jgi:hypothetical protein
MERIAGRVLYAESFKTGYGFTVVSHINGSRGGGKIEKKHKKESDCRDKDTGILF